MNEREESVSRHTRRSEFATASSIRNFRRLALRKTHLNEDFQLTILQVLAVDLLNPSPAAYAYNPASSPSTCD
jgi:hypothetical protein